jgi:hypothetical protein
VLNTLSANYSDVVVNDSVSYLLSSVASNVSLINECSPNVMGYSSSSSSGVVSVIWKSSCNFILASIAEKGFPKKIQATGLLVWIYAH